ncbi:sporulation protein YqfC [Sporohalobacter salinus]|uniref:sporulation protein YqfC n=1 Tax=Sporohalobacter salinus TaxID=1494606 RepID=UPI00196217E6|nr:sporulation protein YqfC [Sporohalobacter salinus]MBM7623155.1 sporulation protein YqfC [Sporohalobacter salinus]
MSKDRKITEKIKNKFADFFEMPKDIVLDAPQISMIGNMDLVLKNHRGIIEYTQEKIRVRINKGQVVICGEELIIANLTKEMVSVKGQIVDVSFKFN